MVLWLDCEPAFLSRMFDGEVLGLASLNGEEGNA